MSSNQFNIFFFSILLIVLSIDAYFIFDIVSMNISDIQKGLLTFLLFFSSTIGICIIFQFTLPKVEEETIDTHDTDGD